MKYIELNKTYNLRHNKNNTTDLSSSFSLSMKEDSFHLVYKIKDKYITTKFNKDNANLFKSDCVEFFISGDGDLSSYKEYEVSLNNYRFEANITNLNKKDSTYKKVDINFLSQINNKGDEYEIIIDIPFECIPRFKKDKFLFNAFRIKLDKRNHQQLFSLNPTRKNNFHLSKYFIGIKK